MKVVQQLDTGIWRDVVHSNSQGNIFHTPEMFEVISRTKGSRPELWAVVDDKSQVLNMLLPVRVTLVDGLGRSFTTRSIVYGGIFYTGDNRQLKALDLLLQAYVKQTRGTLFTELRHQTENTWLQPVLQHHHFSLEEHCNYLINLNLPVEQVWQNIGKSARKKIARIQRQQEFTIEELHDRTLLPIWYSLIQKTYANARVPLADYSLFEAAFDVLYPKGMIQFLLGRVGEHYVAGSVALLYKETIYGWYRGFNRDYSAYLPNDVMVWHLLKWGVENGYKQFDFGGAGKPSQEYGPRAFKAKFGGDLVVYNRNTYLHAPLRLKLSEAGYGFLRKFYTFSTGFNGNLSLQPKSEVLDEA